MMNITIEDTVGQAKLETIHGLEPRYCSKWRFTHVEQCLIDAAKTCGDQPYVMIQGIASGNMFIDEIDEFNNEIVISR